MYVDKEDIDITLEFPLEVSNINFTRTAKIQIVVKKVQKYELVVKVSLF